MSPPQIPAKLEERALSSFQVGDVLVCVEAGPVLPEDMHKRWSPALERGRSYRVSAVTVDRDDGEQIIQVDGRIANSSLGYWAGRRFRKIRPADEQFTEQLRACKPQRIGEPA